MPAERVTLKDLLGGGRWMNDSDKGVENVILRKLPLQTSAQHILPETRSQLTTSSHLHTAQRAGSKQKERVFAGNFPRAIGKGFASI